MEVQVTRAAAIMRNLEPLTVGMSKAVPVKLTMSADWDGLAKTAIFKAGTTQIDVTDAAWVDATTVFVPPEVLTKAGSRVQFGLYGTDSDDAIVIPTIWVNLGKVQPAPDPSGDPTVDPTLPVWAQIQGQMVDNAEVVDGDLIITLHNGTELNAGYVIGPWMPCSPCGHRRGNHRFHSDTCRLGHDGRGLDRCSVCRHRPKGAGRSRLCASRADR